MADLSSSDAASVSVIERLSRAGDELSTRRTDPEPQNFSSRAHPKYARGAHAHAGAGAGAGARGYWLGHMPTEPPQRARTACSEFFFTAQRLAEQSSDAQRADRVLRIFFTATGRAIWEILGRRVRARSLVLSKSLRVESRHACLRRRRNRHHRPGAVRAVQGRGAGCRSRRLAAATSSAAASWSSLRATGSHPAWWCSSLRNWGPPGAGMSRRPTRRRGSCARV